MRRGLACSYSSIRLQSFILKLILPTAPASPIEVGSHSRVAQKAPHANLELGCNTPRSASAPSASVCYYLQRSAHMRWNVQHTQQSLAVREQLLSKFWSGPKSPRALTRSFATRLRPERHRSRVGRDDASHIVQPPPALSYHTSFSMFPYVEYRPAHLAWSHRSTSKTELLRI